MDLNLDTMKWDGIIRKRKSGTLYEIISSSFSLSSIIHLFKEELEI
jgi:hypothetical protein